MAKSNIIKTPEQVQMEAAKSLAFNKAKIAVLEKVLSMREELGDDTFDGSDAMIRDIPSGKADVSVTNLKQLISIAVQAANAVGIDFKENLSSYIAVYVKIKEREQKKDESKA